MTSGATPRDSLEAQVREMSDAIVHRGPDDCGHWVASDRGVALGFRRLSIIDLTPAGHQPMQSATGRFTLIFNGEVYNYVELRRELTRDGASFSGNSDTEVILAAFERYGIRAAVERFVGMFAMAVWDASSRQLSLVRDRLGKKPLYYYHRPGLLTFGSELKALAAGPELDRTIDETALAAYLRYLYVPAPHSIYRKVRKLLPGHVLTVSDVSGSLPESLPYWSLGEAYRAGRERPFEGSDQDAVEELHALLLEAVRVRMRSDVPMGALLSGGIDSSTIVALMQQSAASPVRTFSIGFPGTAHDEARHAAEVARTLGTAHTEMSVSGGDALAVVPSLPDLFDEPFADPSQIPTFLVSKLARQAVTVALSGDGGDELFAGYERYIQGERVISGANALPPALRRIAGSGIEASSSRLWESAYRRVAPVLDRSGRHRLAGLKFRKLGPLLREATRSGMYRSLLSASWSDTDSVMTTAAGHSRVEQTLEATAQYPLLDQMMLTDQSTYLADDLLAKVDRASMAVSLEARVPLLDHRVVEFSWRLGREHKIRDGRGKWALRQVLYRMIDPRIVDRPKTGFTVPVADWLRGPLRSWACDLLFSSQKESDLIRRDRVQQAWSALERGGDEHALALWSVLMFQAWSRRWLA